MSMPKPSLSATGKAQIGEIIANVVKTQSLPAIFLTACNAEEVLYENQDGWMDFMQQDGKRVDVDTSESGFSLELMVALRLFSMTKLVTAVSSAARTFAVLSPYKLT
jgi:hypothetical protein